jgi:hypothetical protein
MSALEIRVFDGINARAPLPVMNLRLVSERVTGRELIERRVRQEVAQQNREPAEFVRTLVRPTHAEETLNGYRLRAPAPLDADAQVERALEAFTAKGFFLLVDDRQIEQLDESFIVTPTSRVTFIKLVQLVGG